MTTHGNWEHPTSGGAAEWTGVQTPPQPSLSLRLVIQQMLGKPDYWSIFVAPRNGIGKVYKVEGSPECMHYAHEEGIDITVYNSFKTAITLRTELSQEEAELIAHYANNEMPPSALNRTSAAEICEMWIIQVIERLSEEGIVTREWVTYIRSKAEEEANNRNVYQN